MKSSQLYTALIAAGVGLLLARIPVPDPAPLMDAMSRLAADIGFGFDAMLWEARRLAGSVETPAPETVAILAITLVGVGVLVTLLVRRPASAPSRVAPTAPGGRVDRARALSGAGRLSIDVARETALSRDAVELLARMGRADGIAGSGRTFRQPRRRSPLGRGLARTA